ncbi:MAG: C-type lectin domain-containing protein [Myxococcales bacterium]|nr:C-type lectin domain-containing protein [Myxococcales bacterium]
MRGLVIALTLAGCGFSAPAGQQQPPAHDAPAPSDAPAPGDGPPIPDGPMIDAPVGPQCPAGYAAIPTLVGSTSQYRFVNAPQASWIAAEMDCENDGDTSNRPTHLIVLDDASERAAMIAGPLGAGAAINDQWIGLTDLADEDDFIYVTNQQNTLTLAPTMDADNKDCVRIKDSGNAEARDCNETNRYVCECDMFPAQPNTFPNLPDGNNGD